MVVKAKAKIIDNKIYPKSVRDELGSYTLNTSNTTTEFYEIENIYKRLIKSGNAEKFYSSFYSRIVLNAASTFDGLSRNAATLLSTKIADSMLAHSKEKVHVHVADNVIPDLQTKLSDEEIAGLQYIGGYVLHKLYNRQIKIGKPESEQSTSVLKAGKVEDHNAIENQKLTSSLNRGGLWAISKNAQLIFERTEHHFRVVTSKPSLQRIDISTIVSISVCDIQVVSAYEAMLSDSELIIDNNIGKDVLHNIINLYVRVRSFSFAKDIIQKHKIKSKQMKAKALRKDISRASTECKQQRQP